MSKALFRGACAPSLLRVLACHCRTLAGRGGRTEKGQSRPWRLQRPQPRPSRALGSGLPRARTSPVARNPSRLSAFLPPLPPPGPARPAFRALNTLFRLRRRRRRQLGPGLPPLPQGPAPGCLRAPGTERNVEPPRRPPSRLASRRRLCPETRVCTSPTLHARAHGAWAARAGNTGVNASSRGRSHPERQPTRRGDATITVKTNPHPLGPPARLGRPRDAAAALAGGGDHSLDTPPLYPTHTETGRGAGRGAGPLRAGPIPSAGALPDSARRQWAGGACPLPATRSTSSSVHNGPEGRTVGRPAQMKRGLRGKWVDWSHPGTKVEKGKEMEKIQGTRELTNREWAGGRERWELEPKPTGAKRRDFLLCSPSLSFVS